jgi:NADH:ubiquinone oxidoreductase subunit K
MTTPSAVVGGRPPRTTVEARHRAAGRGRQVVLRTLWVRWAPLVFLGLGVAARIRQWLGDRSLWLDEVLVADNIVHRGFWQLTEPLAHYQVAPVLWLELERLATVLFGTGERALRLVPLLAGLLTLGLAWVVARRLLPEVLVPVALLLVCLHPALIYYSNEVKQYSTDVAVVLVLVLLAQEVPRRTDAGPALRRLAIAGAVCVWLSHAALLVMAGLSAVLVLRPLGAPDLRRVLRVVRGLLPWVVSAVVLYLLVLRRVPHTADLADYWAGTFPRSAADLPAWLVRRWYAVAHSPLRMTVRVLGLALLAVGLVRLWRYAGRWTALVWAGVPVALIAAAASAYPFADRLALWIVPGACFALAAALPRTLDRAGLVWLLIASALLTVAMGPAMATGLQRTVAVQHVEELRPLLEQLARERRPSDVVLVEYGSQAAFDYYARSTGVRRDGVIALADRLGSTECDDRPALDTGRFLTDRVWVVTSHRLSDGPRLGTLTDLLARIRAATHEEAHLHRTSADAFLFDPSQGPDAPTRVPNPDRCLAVFRSAR